MALVSVAAQVIVKSSAPVLSAGLRPFRVRFQATESNPGNTECRRLSEKRESELHTHLGLHLDHLSAENFNPLFGLIVFAQWHGGNLLHDIHS